MRNDRRLQGARTCHLQARMTSLGAMQAPAPCANILAMLRSCSLLALCAVASALAESAFPKPVEELETAYAKNPRDVDVALELGVRYHHQMREAGHDGAYGTRQNRKGLDALHQKSMKYLKRAQFMTQFGPVPNAYIGSLTVLRGRDVSHSNRGLLVRWRGPKNFMEGPQMIDAAVQQDIENVTARLVRIEDAEHIVLRLTDGSDSTVEQKWVPRLDRFQVALEDLEFLLQKCEGDPELARKLHVAGLHFRAGKLAERLAKYEIARQHLKVTIEAAGESDLADEARALLEKLPK